MTIKKSNCLLNFMMFCLGATVGRRIGDPYLMRHLAAKSADLMLVNLPHSSPERYTQNRNHEKVLLHKPNKVCCKLSGACQLYCCFKLACDVADFKVYWLCITSRVLPQLPSDLLAKKYAHVLQGQFLGNNDAEYGSYRFNSIRVSFRGFFFYLCRFSRVLEKFT
jgi:hypothetical protein